jgi:erythromycin esterase
MHPLPRHSLVSIVTAACIVAVSAAAQSTPDRAAHVSWLQSNTAELSSVNPADTDFSDLAPLKEAIGNSRIVMLGEESHGDGTVFLAKTRLIKYLHEQLGFDVLAFESGLYDMPKAWEHLKNGEDPVPSVRSGVFGIWSRSEQFQPLIDYLGEQVKADHPLELTGFDCQFTASSSHEHLRDDLVKFFADHGVAVTTQAHWTSFQPILDSLIQGSYYSAATSSAQQQIFLSTMDGLISRAATFPARDSAVAFWKQNLKSMRAHAAYVFVQGGKMPPTIADANNGRDAQMADNLLWLAQQRYPGKKIIVWAATFHNMRNPEPIAFEKNKRGYAGLHNMGDLVWKVLGNQIYNIGFVASQGSAGPWRSEPHPITTPPAGSLEDLWSATTHNIAFLDLRHLAPSGGWLEQPLVAGPLGYSPARAKWPQVLDAMIYTRTMEPNTKSGR